MRTKIQQILIRHWGHSQFRPLQEDIILSVLDGNDTLALMPTGGGKSICFQVPAMAKDGLCLVISPLIALMKDQVENLNARGIPAVAVISGMSRREIDHALDNCAYGKEKFLYLSPERLTSELFINRVEKMNINLVAVDESHCVSQWGYDFRPAYLKIAEIRSHLKDVPILALTASATPEVQADIQDKLNFRKPAVFKKSFGRENLSYVVLHEEDKLNRMLKVISGIPGTGIVYVRTRKRTREIAEFLSRNKINAGYYHAGLLASARSQVQEDWMKGKSRIVVATNAFGMGIDKSNVRFVIHLDIPDGPEAYYQEAGRAGRDEQKAYAVLMYNDSDKAELTQRLEISFPDLKLIRKIYQGLGNYYQLPVGSGKGESFDFDISDFCNTYNLSIPLAFNAIKVLEMQGLIASTDSADIRARLMILFDHSSLYQFQVQNPLFDPLIKVLLRSYDGLFDDYVTINESEIAGRTNLSKEETLRQLNLMTSLKLIDYLPAKESPQLTFIEERLETKNLQIDRAFLADRKERFLKRIRAMWNYVSEKNECRSKLLLEYFGEKSQSRCGVCDYCLERNKMGVSDLEFQQIHSAVQTMLVSKKLSLQNLIESINPMKEEKSLKVITWLIENEKIRYIKGDKLEWIGKN